MLGTWDYFNYTILLVRFDFPVFPDPAKLRFQPQIQGLDTTASNCLEKTTSESGEPLLLERDMQRGSSSPPPRWEDGMFLARQVQIGSPELEGEEEDGGCG